MIATIATALFAGVTAFIGYTIITNIARQRRESITVAHARFGELGGGWERLEDGTIQFNGVTVSPTEVRS